MIPKDKRGSYHGGYQPQTLIDQNKVILPDSVIRQMTNLDSVTFTCCSGLDPRPVHEYSKELDKSLDKVIGYWIWVVQNGDPLRVKVMQPSLPRLVRNQTLFKLKNLGGLYYKPQRKYYYRADALEVVNQNDAPK